MKNKNNYNNNIGIYFIDFVIFNILRLILIICIKFKIGYKIFKF